MLRHRRLLAFGTLGAVLATQLIAGEPAGARPTAPVSTAAAPAATPVSTEPGQTRVVTLLTGDRVSVTAGQLTVSPRAGVQFLRFRRDEADYIVPSDAIALLKADRLDDRLFNVSALLDFEFDKLSYLPLVVSDAAAVRGLATEQRLAAVDGFATKVPVTDLATTWQTTKASLTGGKIWLDGVRESTLDVSVPMIGTPAAWAAGYDGTGVTVAVLDTGVDDTHPDLAGSVVARRNFVTEMETGLDLNGHGTHVASTIAGSGAASGGRYKGVAPGVDLLDGKVCWNVQGRGNCSDSAILAAMQWAAESGAKVVNLSLGGPDEIGVDPLEQAINDLSAEYGTLFVCSAGNVPLKPIPVGSPSTADAALSVANFDKTGALHWSSLQGPRIGDYAVKPDIGGPGTDIYAARSPSALAHMPEGPYVPLTGTSMASPHVAGAAALLAHAHPDWKGGQLKETLMASAVTAPDLDVFAQGAGIVNVARALGQQVTVTPASLSVGALAWPHTEAPTARTMTYHNRGDAPLTLDLALDGNAPDGLLALSATTVTVPAGGDASVDVVVDETASDAYGFYSGRIVATGGAVSLRTPFSVYLEPPAATLRVTAIDRNGSPPANVMMTLIKPDPSSAEDAVYYTASRSRRAPLNSTWHITAYIVDEDGTTTMVTSNKVVITGDMEVVLDARKARPLDITVPDPRASAYNAAAVVNRTADGLYTHSGISGDLRALRTADIGPKGLPGVITQVHAVFQARPEKGRAPSVYQVGWRTEGSFITGLVKHVKRRELATVDVGYARNATDVRAWRTNAIYEPSLGGAFPLTSDLPPVVAPARRTEYYTGDLRWRSTLRFQSTVDDSLVHDLMQAKEPSYRSGRRYGERWNGAVLNTTLTPLYEGSPAVVRQGDTFWANFGAWADGEGHVGFPYPVTNHHLSLHRGDVLLGEFTGTFGNFGNWDVSAEPATYRMSYSADLPAPFRLSSRVESVWTFTSSAEQQNELPLTSVGFRPSLGLENSARAGSTVAVPLTFAQQATAAKVRSVSVSVSFDGGATWSAVPAVNLLGTYTAAVSHPRGRSGFVSLRATAVDAKGNSVTTTVLRAYQLT
ncbi:S8 family peptidase [Phytohabitans houttuyneae]|uniref:Serine protease n=1 Tax=Phytohabitans houttuyneae TaxID=1076126 RepID=A0A6V8KFH3_9ACTN|nr:S8 family serine peptidase [Phytohabitans houttuyneae]GFJ81108.1 serine protease [Phytohabitans houttuyneae]